MVKAMGRPASSSACPQRVEGGEEVGAGQRRVAAEPAGQADMRVLAR